MLGFSMTYLLLGFGRRPSGQIKFPRNSVRVLERDVGLSERRVDLHAGGLDAGGGKRCGHAVELGPIRAGERQVVEPYSEWVEPVARRTPVFGPAHRDRRAAGEENEHVGRVERYGEPQGLRVELSRSEEHTSELQSLAYLVCRLL